MAYNELLESPKFELINGVEVMMSPANTKHNSVQRNLALIVGSYLRGKRCRLFFETMVCFDKNTHFIPDLLIVCDRNKIHDDGIYGAPDLVVEILSNSTKKKDIGIKKETYEKFGVKEYWIVSPQEKNIEVFLLENGKYMLDNVYSIMEEWELKSMTEQQRAEHNLILKVSLYDDLEIDIRSVFEDL